MGESPGSGRRPASPAGAGRVVHVTLCETLPERVPSAAHADRAGLSRSLGDWLQGHDLLESPEVVRMLESGLIPEQEAAAFPGCRDSADAELLCQWLLFSQSFDDRFDSAPLSADPELACWAVRPCLDVLETARTGRPGPGPVSTPWAVAFADWLARACQSMGPAWIGCLISELEAWMRAYVAESAHRAHGYILAPTDLIAHKRRCMADAPNALLIERTACGELSPLAREILRPITDTSSDIAGAVNDLASLSREQQLGDVHNLVLSFMQHEQDSQASAVNKVKHLVTVWTTELSRLMTTLPPDPAIQDEYGVTSQWAVLRGAFIRGYHDWTLQTGRYDAPGDDRHQGREN
jgi:Terpene synthase family 2, C-terminal metal binding